MAVVPPEQRAGIAAGHAGVALFLATRAVTDGDAADEAAALAHLDAAIDVSGQLGDASFYDGFVGVAWVMAHVARLGLIEGVADALGDVDAALHQLLSDEGWQPDHGHSRGLVGIANYCLARAAAPRVVANLELVVDRLEATAEQRPGGIAWRTPARLLAPHRAVRYPQGVYNVGVAHGHAGVIAALAAIASRGIQTERCAHLVRAATAWLMANRHDDAACATFPGLVTIAGQGSRCRSAWCFGDPGIGAALFFAARQLGDVALGQRATAILRKATARPLSATGVVDGTLCHGAAGLAYLFLRVADAAGDDAMRSHASAWYARTLAHLEPETTPVPPGFLLGKAGIGLALLAAVRPVATGWDGALALHP